MSNAKPGLPHSTPLYNEDDDLVCYWCDRPLTCAACDAPAPADRAHTFERWLTSHSLRLLDKRTGRPPPQLAYLVERLFRDLDSN